MKLQVRRGLLATSVKVLTVDPGCYFFAYPQNSRGTWNEGHDRTKFLSNANFQEFSFNFGSVLKKFQKQHLYEETFLRSLLLIPSRKQEKKEQNKQKYSVKNSFASSSALCNNYS